VVAVSKLSQWPLVLRPEQSLGNDHYTMVGAAYVGGIKSGEEVLAKAAERRSIRVVHLV
jgi:hypothetical protein